jgi:hypothetical protein
MNRIKISSVLILVGLSLILLSCKKDKKSIPVLTTDSVSTVTQTTAICGGTISSDGGSVILERGVCWSTEGNPTINDNKTIDGTGPGAFISSIADLTANTTYYIRAYATNDIGTAYGSQDTFNTLEDIILNYEELTSDKIVAKNGLLSKAVIEGTNANGHALSTSNVIIYKTNNNRYGKLQILGIDDASNFKLTIKAVTYNDDGTIYSQTENLAIRGTWQCDLDAMAESEVDIDFKWNRTTSTNTYLQPITPAVFVKYK